MRSTIPRDLHRHKWLHFTNTNRHNRTWWYTVTCHSSVLTAHYQHQLSHLMVIRWHDVKLTNYVKGTEESTQKYDVVTDWAALYHVEEVDYWIQMLSTTHHILDICFWCFQSTTVDIILRDVSLRGLPPKWTQPGNPSWLRVHCRTHYWEAPAGIPT